MANGWPLLLESRLLPWKMLNKRLTVSWNNLIFLLVDQAVTEPAPLPGTLRAAVHQGD